MTTKSIVVETGDERLVLPTFATVGWTPEDIHKHRTEAGLPAWTDEEAAQFLASVEYDIEEAMIERGWEVLTQCIDEVEREILTGET
jgi:hypothetical protein